MLVDIRELLRKAKKEKYGIISTSPVFEFLIKPILSACEEKHSPIILSVTENQMIYNDIDNVGPAIIWHAEKASVPVAVILDHGKTGEVITKAIRLGFNAIMFDGSDLPVEKNIEKTSFYAEIAHTFGIAIEGELGYIGGHEGTTVSETESDYRYTDVETALHFYEKTGVDILAVAVGNIHGITMFAPKIDFERLKEISETLPIPIGMHGCSGIKDVDMKKAIACGLSKVNFYSDMSKNIVNSIRKMVKDEIFVNFPLLINRAQKVAYETICNCCDIYGSTGKA